MAKPRVIIADTDINYIIPLQIKFTRDFFDKIELEIITDAGYFEAVFSTPQKADIILVSDDLYTPALQKHNISNIFLMTEYYEEGATGELNVNRLYKYSNIKEIFNTIIGKSAGVLSSSTIVSMDTQIVLVTSANGGAGKTTVAMGMAACLTQNHKKVLYINASRLQIFQHYLDNQTAISSQEVYSKLMNPSERIYQEIKHVIRYEQFYYLPAFKAALMSIGLRFSLYETIALSVKYSKEFDYIIIDAESSFDENTTRLHDIADKIVVVTGQSENAVHATNVLVSNLNGISADRYIFVCNNYNMDIYNALVSPGMNIKFPVNEYIHEFDTKSGKKSCAELGENNDIRKISFLIV